MYFTPINSPAVDIYLYTSLSVVFSFLGKIDRNGFGELGGNC